MYVVIQVTFRAPRSICRSQYWSSRGCRATMGTGWVATPDTRAQLGEGSPKAPWLLCSLLLDAHVPCCGLQIECSPWKTWNLMPGLTIYVEIQKAAHSS